MSLVNIVCTEGKNGTWWEVQETHPTMKIPGVDCVRRLGVFSTIAQVHEFLYELGVLNIKETATNFARKETR